MAYQITKWLCCKEVYAFVLDLKQNPHLLKMTVQKVLAILLDDKAIDT